MKQILSIIVLMILFSCKQKEQMLEPGDTPAPTSDRLVDGKLKSKPTDTISGIQTKVNTFERVAIDEASQKMFDERLKNAIQQSDDEIAWTGVAWAWGNDGPCTQTWMCMTHVGNFEISFSDGNFGFGKVVHRMGNSAHDCIQNAKDAMKPPHPDRGLAVAWVMASQIHNKPYYEWLRLHGDAVLNALRRIPG